MSVVSDPSLSDRSRGASGAFHVELHVDIAAGGVGIRTDFFVGFLGERFQLGLRQARILHMQPHGQPEAAALARPIDTAAVTLALVASFLCCLPTKSSAPPKQAA